MGLNDAYMRNKNRLESQPKYFKFHRVYSTKKHCNGTVLKNFWSDKANDWCYEIITDVGEKICATHWTLESEHPIPWYIGQSAHDLETEQNCKIIDIVGYNSINAVWIFEVQLESGEKVRRNESKLTHFYKVRRKQNDTLSN